MNDTAADGRIATRVGPLHVRQAGDGPVAVLWHSLFVDSASWRRVESELARHRSLVLIDGPGHGRSGDPGRRYTMEDCAAAAFDVLDALGVTDPVDWVGNAWGGHVGTVAAADHPGRLRSLVAVCTPIAAYDPAEHRRVQLLAAAYRALGPRQWLANGVVEVMLAERTREQDAEAVALIVDSLRQADRRMLYNSIQSISLHRTALDDCLPRLGVPTLIATGADDVGFTPDQARAAAMKIPRGRAAVIPDAAYLAPFEQPTATTELILDLWASLG